MTPDQADQLRYLLNKYVKEDLDQHDAWRIDAGPMVVYIHISHYPYPGTTDDNYTDITL